MVGEPSTALTDINLDHLVKLAVDTDMQTTAHNDSVFGHLMATAGFSGGGAYDRTDDSQQSMRDRGDAAWVTASGFAVSGEPLTAQEVEDTVWDTLLTGASHNSSTSAGKRLRQTENVSVLREEEQAQGGSSSTITLHTDASSIDAFYDDTQVVIVGDTGIGQSRHIHAYVGSTRVASVTPNWATSPDATSDYAIRADSEKHVHEIDDDVITATTITDSAWQELIELLFDFDATATYASAKSLRSVLL